MIFWACSIYFGYNLLLKYNHWLYYHAIWNMIFFLITTTIAALFFYLTIKKLN